MKKLIAILGIAAVGMTAYGQGSINFVNLGVGLSAPVNQADGSPVPVGSGFTAQLLAGVDEPSLAPVGDVTMNWPAAGFFNGGIRTVPTVAPGTQATLKVLVWENSGGTIASYEAAQGAGVQYGESTVWTSNPLGGGVPPAAPPALQGMTSFTLVPEPSTYALLALGAAALFLRRRK